MGQLWSSHDSLACYGTGSTGEGVERKKPPTLSVGVEIGAATMENSMEFL